MIPQSSSVTQRLRRRTLIVSVAMAATFTMLVGGLVRHLPAEASSGTKRVFAEDTTITSRLALRPGDSIELRNGAQVSFGEGGYADWRGTPTTTWSDEGRTKNLKRDIKIFGEGDIRFLEGSKKSVIKWVEIDLQPKDELGHYPLHWHHAGDGSRGTIVQGVVIKNSPNRAFVPHASHGITFRDNIVKNVVRQGFWWDPPCACDGETKERFHTKNNSNDIKVVRMLIDGVSPAPNGEGEHTLSAFALGAGSGNVIRDSVARNVDGGKNSSGFHWPSKANLNVGGNVWTAVNLRAYNVVDGIFVWQNDFNDHRIKRFKARNVSRYAIEHGAYKNAYVYVDPDVKSLSANALGKWKVVGGTVGTVHIGEQNPSATGRAVFRDVDVSRVVVNNAKGGAPGRFVFTRTGLSCSDVNVRSLYPGTVIKVDGVRCT